ncbi:DUF1800 domain-containing protein [filamentous cyanobacterium LEGE 11480]|uniref:DUF1800 domain-containing protein n=1 Tax=Romeriopsis navalis LEGE 11480 TaxID=2777977 RepID=A0A928Z591_9CYAN|nr:DUF1800 domain-containing protein [Romeriopsis navalis]MBE9031010.1 DUF1800 domain-containing protein [Romeriopsis navalis LEGE 11480]
MKRRAFVSLAVVGGTAWLSGIRPAAAATPDPKVLHVLNRLGFGPRPGDVARVSRMGVERYIQEQLSPEKLREPANLQRQLNKFATLKLDSGDLVREYRRPGSRDQRRMRRRMLRRKRRQVVEEARSARLLRAVESPRQLEEVMVDFWFNHFNVYAFKGLGGLWIGSYERDAIRPYVMGNFREILGATAKHPAMLLYLDNWRNTAPDSPGARGRFKGLNENYARELMELHTMGADGGYTQKDVETLARVLTGWGLANYRRSTDTGFYFDARRHDVQPKVVLGQQLTQTGEQEGEAALDLLASHPSTAKFISFKLAQYFVTDNPPQRLVDRLQKRFQATQGNIRAVLATLFQSDEFWDERYFQKKYKTPYRYMISAVRSAGIDIKNPKPLVGALAQLSMPLYGAQTPDGYDQVEKAWLNPDGMMRRLNFAVLLGGGRSRLEMRQRKPIEPGQLSDTAAMFLQPGTLRIIASKRRGLRSGLILGSPEFMYH